MKTIAAKDARSHFSELLDNAESGKSAVVIRNSKPAATIMPPEYAKLAPMIDYIIHELGLSIEMSEDSAILKAFAKAQKDLEQGKITWIRDAKNIKNKRD